MHVRELVELAALLAGHAETLVEDQPYFTKDGLSEYWSASKSRLAHWQRSLSCFFEESPPRSNASIGFVPAAVEPLIHEIFAAEVLTRVWTGIMALCDAAGEQRAATSIAQSVLIHHEDVRRQAYRWLIHGPLAGTPDADAVNLVRRRTERWTDLLLANMAHLGDTTAYGFDQPRLSEFARDIDQDRRAGSHETSWAVTVTSLRTALRVGLTRESHSRNDNSRIAGAVLACFGPELFTSTGTLRSAWLSRLQRITSDTQVMLGDLLRSELTQSALPR